MIYNTRDNLYYMTSVEYAADTKIKAIPTAKVYVYETGKMYVTDGTTYHEYGVADAV